MGTGDKDRSYRALALDRGRGCWWLWLEDMLVGEGEVDLTWMGM